MALQVEDIIVIIYVCFQIVVTIVVSILGAFYVQNEFKSKKIAIIITHLEKTHSPYLHTRNFCKMWFKVAWKLRSVYASFAVHLFDVLTDILVIIEWFHLEPKGKNNVRHIDANIMAICGIAVLLFHKLISTLAFWVKEKNFMRCFLQFTDLLILQELYICHKKIVTQFQNQSKTSTNTEHSDIETTLSFKFVRNLEAVFESIPQSILQLVFIVRSNSLDQYGSNTLKLIAIASIIQSVISMTNSILKNDNIYMNLPKWKRHKQRLPPTLPFVKHALCRISEIIYRIGLLCLFWTVCGGTAFTVLLSLEMTVIFCMTAIEYKLKKKFGVDIDKFGVEDIFLRVQMLIVLPSELVYTENGNQHLLFNNGFDEDGEKCPAEDEEDHNFNNMMRCCFTLCCCYWPAVLLTTLGRFTKIEHYIHPTFRIGASLIQWLILILWAFVVILLDTACGTCDGRIDVRDFYYLFSIKHGLSIFIASIICFFIYTQYLSLSLFPHFALPLNVSVRSRFGYAFNGELEELQRLKEPTGSESVKIMPPDINMRRRIWNMLETEYPQAVGKLEARLFKQYLIQEFATSFYWAEFWKLVQNHLKVDMILTQVCKKEAGRLLAYMDKASYGEDVRNIAGVNMNDLDKEQRMHVKKGMIEPFAARQAEKIPTQVSKPNDVQKMLIKEVVDTFSARIWRVCEKELRDEVESVKRQLMKSEEKQIWKLNTQQVIDLVQNNSLKVGIWNCVERIRFWEAPAVEHDDWTTCAVFALANEHYHIVAWLSNEKGVMNHRDLRTLLQSELNKCNAHKTYDPEIWTERDIKRDQKRRLKCRGNIESILDECSSGLLTTHEIARVCLGKTHFVK